MLKRLACLLAFAACTILPARAETIWQFQYTGLYDEHEKAFLDYYTIYGLFAGTDSDGDGVVEQSEITRFMLDGVEYMSPYLCLTVTSCVLNSFSYSLTGDLNFDASWTYSDSNAYTSVQIVAGVAVDTSAYPDITRRYTFTDQTAFTITPPPIPEPGAALMLLTGLALLGSGRVAHLVGKKQGTVP